ncbi:protein LYK5 [Rhodamnia argentea]|uniref:Protein LYK5 n=1 Tax=Rhodamnia argentea TaxID=178133 RepID=A0A8B8MWB4_9MYRT|nr:protein LYK5 [Rhodamnia argentea]XP_048129611.1 protein LYK5 [Rhodamnia argentea]XP_048129612.1 protein LYK5 [Rhodamnia argentea]
MESAISLYALSSFFSFLLLLLHQPRLLLSQQAYVNNKQLACDDTTNDNLTEGFACNGLRNSCRSYVTFRSNPPAYASLVSVSYLLNSQPYIAEMTSINNLTDVEPVASDTLIIAPVDCACTSSSPSYYQHNASYVLKSETYMLLANDTYQGLTTCQALMAQNPYDARNLTKGLNLTVPVRCACPTATQSSAGARYLLAYLVTWGDDISSIAEMFGVSEKSVLDANELTEKSTIYPFTPILVPLPKEPTKIVTAPPPASPPATPSVPAGNNSGSSKKWVFVGVGVGGGVLVIALALWFFCYYSQKRKQPRSSGLTPKKFSETSTTDDTTVPVKGSSYSGFSSGVRDAIETLTVYTYQDLQAATGFFSEENKIKGSVYRGVFKNDDAAVKVLKGDVSSEINILRQINHSNIIRLSGFCVHEGNTYLVYEYAENGSLSDWLHSKKFESYSVLSWKQRVQVAYHIADALNYLHNYTNPPYIHKNLKSSNVLLDANFRAMVANFGLARLAEHNEEGGLQMTRHVVGTQGYMAPEYIENGVITPKLDVFAFGVVMLELLSGREAAGDSKNGEEMLSAAIKRVLDGDNVRENLRAFIDASLKNDYPLDLAFSTAELAKRCVASDLNARPEMAEVFITLSKIFYSSLDWDPSDELDRSQSMSRGR